MRDPIFHYRITHYDRSILPSRFLAFLEESVVGPEDWIRRSGRSLGHPGWGFMYHLLLCRLHPEAANTIIETGTNLASTSIIMGQAIKDSGRRGVVRSVEIDPILAAEARQRVELAGVSEYVEIYEGDSLEILPDLLDEVEHLPLAYLDGNHFHDHVVSEFELLRPHLSHDTVLVFDNTYPIAEHDEDPRVHGALRTILTHHGGNLVNLPFCSWYTPGVALWQASAFTDMLPPAPDSFVAEKSGTNGDQDFG